LGLISTAEIEYRAQTRDLAWASAAKSRRLYLIWFFSRSYLCIPSRSLCDLINALQSLSSSMAPSSAQREAIGDTFTVISEEK